MKSEKTGLAGPVAVIGLIYAAAMAAAPGAGLSAQADPTQTDPIAVFESHTTFGVADIPASQPEGTRALQPRRGMVHPRSSKAIHNCPDTSGVKMSFAELMRVHHRLPNRSSRTPGVSRPAWGKAKITVF